jgi:serine/threonine protein kinase
MKVKIGDFGLARYLNSEGEAKVKEMCGTFGFKAPEV